MKGDRTAPARAWRKSSFSSGGASNCVEVERGLSWLRDSKNPLVEIRGDVAALAAFARSR